MVDINECVNGNHGCSHDCNNNDGSFTCTCPSGYTLMADLQTCIGKSITAQVCFIYKLYNSAYNNEISTVVVQIAMSVILITGAAHRYAPIYMEHSDVAVSVDTH